LKEEAFFSFLCLTIHELCNYFLRQPGCCWTVGRCRMWRVGMVT